MPVCLVGATNNLSLQCVLPRLVANCRPILLHHTIILHHAALVQVLMGFLVGMGKQGPLRLRLLPLQQFANIGQ